MSNIQVVDGNIEVINSAPFEINLLETRYKGTEVWHQTLSRVGNGVVDTRKLSYGVFEVRLTNVVEFENKPVVGLVGESWGTWIYASFVNHFLYNRPPGSQIFLDGERFQQCPPEVRAFELKVDGPVFQILSASMVRAKVQVGIDTKSIKSDHDAQYQFRFFLDKLASLFSSVGIFKYGDSGEYLDCAQLDNSGVRISYYGQRQIAAQMFHMAGLYMSYFVDLRR